MCYIHHQISHKYIEIRILVIKNRIDLDLFPRNFITKLFDSIKSKQAFIYF